MWPGIVDYCPVVLVAQPNMSVTITKCEAVDAPARQKSSFHPVAKFLISNELKVYEASSMKAVQLLQQQQGADLTGLDVTQVTITADHVKRMLARAFMGVGDVLQYTFGDTAPASTESSERSFVFTHGA